MKDDQRLRAYKYGFTMNCVIVLGITVITTTGVLLLHDWTGLWSMLLMLFSVVPKSDDKDEDDE